VSTSARDDLKLVNAKLMDQLKSVVAEKSTIEEEFKAQKLSWETKLAKVESDCQEQLRSHSQTISLLIAERAELHSASQQQNTVNELKNGE
jgi:hypothetical protein